MHLELSKYLFVVVNDKSSSLKQQNNTSRKAMWEEEGWRPVNRHRANGNIASSYPEHQAIMTGKNQFDISKYRAQCI